MRLSGSVKFRCAFGCGLPSVVTFGWCSGRGVAVLSWPGLVDFAAAVPEKSGKSLNDAPPAGGSSSESSSPSSSRAACSRLSALVAAPFRMWGSGWDSAVRRLPSALLHQLGRAGLFSILLQRRDGGADLGETPLPATQLLGEILGL